VNTRELDAAYAIVERNLGAYLSGGGRLAVIKAPPGSGKTHVLISILLRLVRDRLSVAVAAQTNSQANDICRRVAARDPTVQTVRFASTGQAPPGDFPRSALWLTDKKDFIHGPGITVSTSAKWALTDLARPFDVFAVDEAWQMAWADLMQCAVVSERFMLIGDPGQIPPVVSIDARRWETSPRAPHDPAPSVVLSDPGLLNGAHVGSLPACRRLPHESVAFVKPFYDFDFAAYVAPGDRGVALRAGHRLSGLDDGRPLVTTLPTPEGGPPLEVDRQVAQVAADLVEEMLGDQALVRDGSNGARTLTAKDIGLTSSHRVMNSAISQALGGRFPGVRADTPERWQGLERPVMIAVHPLSGVVDPSPFDLETGRLCVMASRHLSAHIILTRDHVGDTLANLVPSAEQAPGKPDVVGRGHDAHVRFWRQLERAGRIIPLS
jgi:hypothetical protein